MQRARRVLEIGTLGGYSTIWLARALPPDGRLVTLEVSAQHAAVARANIERAGVSNVVEVVEGPAIDSLTRIAALNPAPFDLVFIDADKANNPVYLEWSLRLTRPGSVIIADNVVRNGSVADGASEDPNVRGIRRFIELCARDPRLNATAIQTVGAKGHDGFAIAVVTSV
jgi:predicted O-methyltransferase YrrM